MCGDAEGAFDVQGGEVVFGGAADKIVGAEIKKTQAMNEVAFDLGEDGDAVAEIGDAGEGELKQGVGGVDFGEQGGAVRAEGGGVADGPVADQPVEAAGAERGDVGFRAGGNVDEEGVAGIVVLEAVGFRRSGIPGAGIDSEDAVPVAEGEVVEVCAAGAVGRNLVVCLAVAAEIADGAVGEADAEAGARGFRGVEGFGGVIEIVAVGERCGKEPDAVFEFVGFGGGENSDFAVCPGGCSGFGADAVPQAAVAGEVVVSGQEPPAAGVAFHAGDGLDDGAVFRAFGVEDVAGDEDVAGAVFGGGAADGVDRLETGVGEGGAEVWREAAVGLAELPVGGVDELHDPGVCHEAGWRAMSGSDGAGELSGGLCCGSWLPGVRGGSGAAG